MLLGAVELERRGIDVGHYEVEPGPANGRIGAFVDRYAFLGKLPPHLGGAELEQTRSLLGDLRGYDVVVGTTTATALALAVWKRLGRLAAPVVGVVSGLAEPEHGSTRRALTASLVRQLQAVLYGDGELDATVSLGRGLRRHVRVIQFGVDTGFWAPADGKSRAAEPFVLAIGNDGRRDFATLVDAARLVDVPFRIYTSHPRPDDLPDNVSWRPADWHRQILSDAEVRSLFRSAAVVAVPLRPSLRPSGQSVALQAMACGRPVVLTETDGLWSRSTLVDGRNVLLVPPRDPPALAAALRRAVDSPVESERMGAAARASVLEHSTIERYATELLGACTDALGGGSAVRPLRSSGFSGTMSRAGGAGRSR